MNNRPHCCAKISKMVRVLPEPLMAKAPVSTCLYRSHDLIHLFLSDEAHSFSRVYKAIHDQMKFGLESFALYG